MSFGDDLRAARNEAGLSQTALSKLAGIGQESISQYENDRQQPKYESIEKLEAALGVRFNVPIIDDPMSPQDVPEFTAKDEAPKPRKPRGTAGAGSKAKPPTGMPSLRLQLEMPYRLGATALSSRMPATAGVLNAQAGPCAEAWDTFLLRYPKLRERIEQGAVAADVVNLVMAHMPIIQIAREELAAQQAAAAFATDNVQAA